MSAIMRSPEPGSAYNFKIAINHSDLVDGCNVLVWHGGYISTAMYNEYDAILIMTQTPGDSSYSIVYTYYESSSWSATGSVVIISSVNFNAGICTIVIKYITNSVPVKVAYIPSPFASGGGN